MTDQVATELRGRGRELGQGLLYLVFAEIELAGRESGFDGFEGEGFGDGDEADGRGIASGSTSGARDAVAHAGESSPERLGIEHYFLSCASSDLAVAALVPSGASLT